MGFLDRWRLSRRRHPVETDDELRAFMEAMQPMSALREAPAPETIAEFQAACSAYTELKAVYLYESDFGGEDAEPLVTIGLVLDETPRDPELFVRISRSLTPMARKLVRGDTISQRLDEYSLDRVPGDVSPIFERS